MRRELNLISAEVKDKYLPSSKYVLETSDELIENIINQIETIRVSEKLTNKDMAAILGLSYENYFKIIQRQRKLGLSTFLVLCRVFNYDISKLVGEAYLNTSDSVFRELALFMGQLQPETVKAMSDALSSSGNESPETKERGKILFDALEKVISGEEYQPFYLFSADKPDEEAKQ